MKENPLVSIITPTYNHEKYIEKCIESVLSQTYPNWEMIIVDDGSTDKTPEKIEKFKDERIHYIRQKHVGIWGLKKTYNRALKFSDGELIAVLEGDDFWPPDKLEKQIRVFKDKDVVLSWGKAGLVDSEGKIFDIIPKNIEQFKFESKIKNTEKLLCRNFIPASTVMIRREDLLSIGGFKQAEYTPFVDYPTWLELSLIGKFYPIDEIVGYWRRHRDQVTSRMKKYVGRAKKYSIEFFEKLPPEVRTKMRISVEDVYSIYDQRLASVYFALGKQALTNNRWNEARHYFRETLSKGSFLKKLYALLGISYSYCKMDLEWAARLISKIKERKL
ncbi:hypothetical protein DRN44_00660 [Thermococci archaeon]|nr:MAG: hypothetical protein DRN44_00660 [Thermococci archaeon]